MNTLIPADHRELLTTGVEDAPLQDNLCTVIPVIFLRERRVTMTESPAVITALALKKELDDFARTGDKSALIDSLRQDLCRDWGVSSPERALALAMNELIKEVVPEYRRISRQKREMIGSGSAAQRKQRPNATANRQRRK